MFVNFFSTLFLSPTVGQIGVGLPAGDTFFTRRSFFPRKKKKRKKKKNRVPTKGSEKGGYWRRRVTSAKRRVGGDRERGGGKVCVCLVCHEETWKHTERGIRQGLADASVLSRDGKKPSKNNSLIVQKQIYGIYIVILPESYVVHNMLWCNLVSEASYDRKFFVNV